MKPCDFGVAAIGASRVVGICDENHACLIRHQRQQRIHVRAIILIRGDNHIGRGLPRGDVVHRKTVADINDVIASASIAHGDEVQQFVRTGTTNDQVAVDFIGSAQCLAQRSAGGVRVTRKRRAFIDKRCGRMWAAAKRIFVRG